LRRLTFGLSLPYIGHMKKSGSFQANVDEGRLHAGQDPGNFAKVNVTDQATLK
jgi:hypothetical protein